MQFLVVFAAVAAVASAGTIVAPYSTVVRAPAFDSAVIKSDRIGGNFAYSTAENHAYAVNTPIVQNVATPVAVSYSAPAIAAAPLAYSAPLAYAGYAHAYPAYAHAAAPGVLAL
ncbi:cuticle protein 16.5-like [Neocloeon triangulifer]|uniref:cuticle protein 16.5-like n=1 Tax=Neocloeon triangulifer TaxID=2078957 RepID=UPI00286EFB7F|nr:cuticle protein 16.5-like [Neocloeon triangulifer]